MTKNNISPLSVAFLSLLVGCFVLGFKWLAYWLTGSIALYSDALESFVNIAAATAALLALRVAYNPPDKNHPYGHTKAEYFSAIFEGLLIIIAAILIILEAWSRLFSPIALEGLTIGLSVSLFASGINALLAFYLIWQSRQHYSPALKADGLHIFSDVITSIGVLVGIGLAWLTGWWWLDPLLAILVAVNILWMGSHLLRNSMSGLMDESMSDRELQPVYDIIRAEMQGAIQAHQIRTRRAGHLSFVEFHLVVSADMPVQEAHLICERIEKALDKALHQAIVTIHVEPESELERTGFTLTHLMTK
ncbi:cation diffusion facilitator family transporter [Beggiatoa leptomitoformis]|uniref:Cation diffusion facilitator family transporter n=1 Tax=Beggiatoa leptomitoformis TaxID=288004 RepID=A0A2N9YAI4_9GAMM|nr:cation diffusion facilitator family transporter [Beggiatoa leptomitoformis]ALG67112.1 cation diffusion facilitator family transporter [Beggiatoa leptomitoformis]AUI67493.1 cation diffusion facilitator family transporter [Beggiatoa leptomitoformis]